MDEINGLIREFICMCGKMDVESLKELRSACPQGTDEKGAEIGKFICRTVIDLVTERKQ